MKHRLLKRGALGFVVLLFVTIIAGCGGSSSSEPSDAVDDVVPSETVQPEPSTAEEPVPSEPSVDNDPGVILSQPEDPEFVTRAHSKVAQSKQIADEVLIQFGRSICSDLGTTQDFDDTSSRTRGTWETSFGKPLNAKEADGLVGAAIGSICKEHRRLLR